MSELKIERRGVQILLNSENGKITCALPGGTRFETLAMDESYRIPQARLCGDRILAELHACGLTLTLEIAFRDDVPEIRLSGEGALDGTLRYPAMFDAVPGDVALIPLSEGIAFPVDDPADPLLPEEIPACHSNNSMGFTGQTRGRAWLLAAVEEVCDAVIRTERGADGILRRGAEWQPEKGEWGYPRTIALLAGESGGTTAAMKRYREYRRAQGTVVTLREKRRHLPAIDRLIGAANFWVWHTNGMNALYSPEDREWDTDNGENIRRLCPEMKALGLDDVMWGIFFREDCEYVSYIENEIGWLATHYEIYKDVVNRPEAHLVTPTRLKRNHMIDSWPEDIIVRKDGTLLPTWPIKGKDGVFHDEHALCDIMAVKRALNRIPPDKKKYGWNARFFDTTGGALLNECYSPDHPMTRRDCARYRSILLRLLQDLGMVGGTEMIHEIYLGSVQYNEGSMSPKMYRMEDSGRRMATTLRGDDVPETIDRFMLNPKYRAPLWELAYHDCIVSYWYWGDSAVSCPERIHERDLFCRLYGVPEIYSFSVDNWEVLKDDIVKSYHYTHDVAKQVGYEEMLSFEYLTDDLTVQQTEFESLRVTVNFGKEPYTCADGAVIPAGESRTETIEVKKNA